MSEPTQTDFAATPTLAWGPVTLRAYHSGDEQALATAAEGLDQTWYTSVPSPAEIPAEIKWRNELQRQSAMAPFVVCLHDEPVGMSAFMNLDAANRRLQIGHTWYATAVQGTVVNPAAKLLLLARAFEDLDCVAVEFRTHFHNRRSRAAIEKLGAKQDGILRSHMFVSGVLRDTVVYSIIAVEWPTVKLGLTERLRHF
ncbi:GNAT family N-acetyltransferase [Micrococcoides hystricis]|uniref:GNAT family N-acetyltransferase n=1 Tax=Micrococcoides hystricis TaxID=1572761 RepID=A0ABV6PB38_9MICC